MIRPIVFIFLLFAGPAFGQGAPYTYPFTIVCPEGVVVAASSVTIAGEFAGGHTGDRYVPTYNWTVSSGTIASGQGTPSITVEAATEGNDSISVTLERTFMEAHYPEVQRTATCTFGVVPLPPIGADMPNIEEAAAKSAVTAVATQPYLYAADYSDGVAGCFGNLYDFAEYAKVLQVEPKSTGRIVISESSPAKYRAKMREVVSELGRYGIARDRIVTVYKYVRPNRLLELTELWVVPAKRFASVGWSAEDGTELIRRCPANVQSWLRAC